MRFIYPILAAAAAALLPTAVLSQNGAVRPAPQFSSQLFAPGTPLDTMVQEVLPKPGEEAYRKVAWRLDLGKAREEAQRAGKPLVVFLMDGHPLGGT